MTCSTDKPGFRCNALFVSLVVLLTASCGGGGGGGDGGNGPAPLNISITSHADGEAIIGGRAITLQGKVGSDIQTLSMLQNGTNVNVTLSGNTFSADLSLADRENVMQVSATDTSNRRATKVVNLYYPFLSLENGQAASMVIGQPDFQSGDVNRGVLVSANTLDSPQGNMALDSLGDLYLSDTGNSRILAFSGIPSEYDVDAVNVIGQMDFSTWQGEVGSNSLQGPFGINISNGKLFIADAANNRVLIWSIGATEAETVLGQQSFDTAGAACMRNTMSFPEDVVVVADKIIVVDSFNNRVLIWNGIPAQNGQDADIVLGQQGFDTCVANDSDGDGVSDATPNANTLNYPGSVWSDGTQLVIADTVNNRVLIWKSFPTLNGQNADIVIGQSDMTTNIGGTSQQKMLTPTDVLSNKNQLYVDDYDNCRVLIWEPFPSNNNEPASRVLGYDNFTSGTCAGPSDTSIGNPSGLLISGNKLLVKDEYNNRVMIFQAP